MATPASRRPLRYLDAEAEAASSPAPRGTAGARVQELPPYQPQVAELNATAQRAIQSLNRGVNLKHLSTHLAHASGALTGNAGEINDRLTDAKARYEKSRKRQREREIQRRNESNGTEPDPDEDGDGDASLAEIGRDEAAEKKIEEMEKTVREITARMELGMRRVVDMEVDVDTMKGILQELAQSSREEASSSQAKRRRVGGDGGGRRRLRGDGDDEDEDEELNEDNDSEEEDDPEIVAASRVWSEKLAGHKQEWETLPMAQRYGTHNSYIGFYRVVHEAKHGNDVPPLPHASTWFDHLTTQPPNGAAAAQTTSPRRRRKSQSGTRGANEDADEIAIQSERISIKCPLTLQSFIDPVTSAKCSHSFERTAIENMLSRSRATVRLSDRNVRCIECPVCSAKITKDDLRNDPVLISRVKRLNRLAEMEEEDDGEDDEADGHGEDGDVIMGRTAGNGRSGGRAAQVKVERARSPTRERSVVPNTQFDAVDDDDGEDGKEEEDSDDGSVTASNVSSQSS